MCQAIVKSWYKGRTEKSVKDIKGVFVHANGITTAFEHRGGERRIGLTCKLNEEGFSCCGWSARGTVAEIGARLLNLKLPLGVDIDPSRHERHSSPIIGRDGVRFSCPGVGTFFALGRLRIIKARHR